MMLAKIKTYGVPIALVILALAAYFFGYDQAESKYLLEIETMKLANAQAVIDAQTKVKVQYEKDIQTLTNNLIDAQRARDERVRELEQFINADRDLAACSSDRSRLANLAVRGEELLRRADAYLEALIKCTFPIE